MPLFNRPNLFFSVGLILSLFVGSQRFKPPVLPFSAQEVGSIPAGQTPPAAYDCLYTASLRIFPCRGSLILLLIKRWIATHFEWDTRCWALPLYVEVDQIGQWQRVTVLCLHVTRSGS